MLLIYQLRSYIYQQGQFKVSMVAGMNHIVKMNQTNQKSNKNHVVNLAMLHCETFAQGLPII